MSLRIKAVVDRFVKELKEALDADIQDRIMKEREMQSYIEEREREVAEREAAWKAELSRRESSGHSIWDLAYLRWLGGQDSGQEYKALFLMKGLRATSVRIIIGRVNALSSH
ncbi:uncharacterized protein LOC120266546 isoform X2 [Dioscorea cayenensis subsp. rotundata]|uniref:Uncharacterized protein LOC120266546 isoform X2 n=1 Tax=Dioscorea cayennensis subsp. rotundata TaxID=55577 RepID=A0AB40BTV6_DIOCR|nr:uncharacterized protein LOC120266546 isoform X2 [Dioscorea cayenensis subsp. rotundata]